MTKSELIQKLADRNPHLLLRDLEKIVDTFFDEIGVINYSNPFDYL